MQCHQSYWKNTLKTAYSNQESTYLKAWYKVISITNNQVSQFFSVAKVKFIVFWITMLPIVQKKPYAFCWTKTKFQFIKTEKNNYFDRLTTEGSKSLTLAFLAYSSLVFFEEHDIILSLKKLPKYFGKLWDILE